MQLFVEYNPEEVDRFIEVADAVEDAFPGLVVEGVEVRHGSTSTPLAPDQHII
jgi:hypothetical protein